jgi:hypothetical protein
MATPPNAEPAGPAATTVPSGTRHVGTTEKSPASTGLTSHQRTACAARKTAPRTVMPGSRPRANPVAEGRLPPRRRQRRASSRDGRGYRRLRPAERPARMGSPRSRSAASTADTAPGGAVFSIARSQCAAHGFGALRMAAAGSRASLAALSSPPTQHRRSPRPSLEHLSQLPGRARDGPAAPLDLAARGPAGRPGGWSPRTGRGNQITCSALSSGAAAWSAQRMGWLGNDARQLGLVATSRAPGLSVAGPRCVQRSRARQR